ncbi:unnamed protein product [Orchesella dallaii]|uniref:Myosin tail domain-containing protein n=1 Tax=Orchesella dallaii TaxID=48710 RepID=A0ABP1RL65_9HEXA
MDSYLGRSSASPAPRAGIPRLSLSRLTDEDLWGSPPYSRAQSVGPRSLSVGPKYDSSSNTYRNAVRNNISRRLENLAEDSVVIRAGFSLMPASRTTFRARFEPRPAHQDPSTASAVLTAQIKDFLKRSDHIEQDWMAINPGKKSKDQMSSGVAIRGYQMRHSTSWTTIDDDSSFALNNSDAMSLADIANDFDDKSEASQISNLLPLDEPISQASVVSESSVAKFARQVNELSAELADEQATSAVTSEKLEQEMNEKQKLENQLSSFKSRCQNLETEKQQLELDLAYSISEVNGDSTPDEFNEDSVYKQRWERCKRELEMFKQRLKQREQDHLDQIMILKKSLEKKCSDAWEESEEQRQIVAQLKRRIQKLSSELSDVRCLHQEEASRCALLEKKQRRFDAELSNLNVQLEKEKISKERAIRERDAAVIQVDSTLNEMQGLRLELQMKESKLVSIEAELEETSQLGGSSEQVNSLRKAKNDLQMKVKEQEEELDDLAGQVQSLESTKLRLEMQIEQMRKEHKREVQQREEEIEDVRGSAQKKVKALECQLESEHEERTAVLRAKQEIERKLFELEEYTASQTASQEQISRLKRELKRTRALLKDAQTMLEQNKNDVLGKGMLRQLRHQLEDSESQRTRLSRAKQKVEEELADVLAQLEDISKSRSEAENIKNQVLREKSSYQMQLEETEEQLAEVMKKYKAAVEQLSVDQHTIMEQSIQISELEAATSNLRETIAELSAKLETLEGDQASQQIQKRFQMKIRELETRLELETTTKTRLEGQVARLREHMEKYQEDIKNSQSREHLALDKCRKFERQLRDCKEEILRLTQRESEAQSRRATLEKQLESAELEISTLKNDLKLAMQRIDDLTAVIKECDDVSDYDEDEDSSTESVTSTTELMSMTDPNLPFDFDNKVRKGSDSESFA